MFILKIKRTFKRKTRKRDPARFQRSGRTEILTSDAEIKRIAEEKNTRSALEKMKGDKRQQQKEKQEQKQKEKEKQKKQQEEKKRQRQEEKKRKQNAKKERQNKKQKQQKKIKQMKPQPLINSLTH